MAAVMASSTETATIYVRLLGEGVDVWRPVRAQRLSASTFRLSEAPVPSDEEWSFQPGDTVVAEYRASVRDELVAVARASDFDERSQAALPLAS